MNRYHFLGATIALMVLPLSVSAQWATIKGQISLPNAPAAKKIDVTADKPACLAKGPLFSDELVVNKKNNGVKNVWVYLQPVNGLPFGANEIHPGLAKPKPVEHVIDQPCCMFIPRIVAAREGDTLLIKNNSQVSHNINYNSNALTFNQTLAPKGMYKPIKALAADRSPATFVCNIHPWMGGRVAVFDHPYFTLTDDDGKFEIKDAPVGNYRIFYRHEMAYHKGKEGNKGFDITIVAPTMELKPLTIELAALKN